MNDLLPPQTARPSSSAWDATRDWLMLAGVYFVLALGAVLLARGGAAVATLWYANGAGAAMLLARAVRLRGPDPLPAQRRLGASLRALAPGLAVLAAANAAANLAGGTPIGQSMLFVLPNIIEIALGCLWLLRGDDVLQIASDPSSLCRAAIKGIALPALVGATLGAALLTAAGGGGFGDIALNWYSGTVIGGCAIWPLAWRWSHGGSTAFARAVDAETIAWCLLAAGVTTFSLARLPYPFVYVALPLMGIALRRGFDATTIGVLLISVLMAVLATEGVLAPPPIVAGWEQLLFYLPMLLTLVPPLLLAAVEERKQGITDELAVREQRFRRLYKRSPAMMYSLDPGGRIVAVSDTWLERLGYIREEVVGRPATDFLTDESCRALQQTALATLASEGRCVEVPTQWLRSNGELLDGLLSAVAETDADGRYLQSLAVIDDVTERNRMARELAASALFEVTLQSIGDGVVTTDARGRVVELNPVAELLLGIARHEAVGRPFDDIVRLQDGQGAPIADLVARCIDEGSRISLHQDAWLRCLDGRRCAVQVTLSPIRGKAQERLGMVMVFQDVSAARALAAQMNWLAQHDALTELPNRLLLRDRIEQRCQRARRAAAGEDGFAVLMFDIDHFKNVNDSLGHAAGDQLLRTVAERVLLAVRASDTVCRLGGDEFVVLLDRLNGTDSAADVTRKLLVELARPMPLGGDSAEVSASIGIAVHPQDGTDEQTLLRHADAALYRAKRDGRDRFHFYSPEMDAAASQRLQMEQRIRIGLKEGRFEVHYQPVLCADGRRPAGLEALVRLREPGGRLIGPAEFIPVAEESRLMRPLGLQVLERACQDFVALRDEGMGLERLAVNVSAVQLDEPRFAARVRRVLRTTGMDPRTLEIEITESTLLRESGAQSRTLASLRRLGVTVALDDFGTGYSSLSYLKRLPVDTVKIDRSFVRDIATNPVDREIAMAIIRLATALGLRVVAEGVEELTQFEVLRTLGGPDLQGYAFARPMTLVALRAWLAGPLEPVEAMPPLTLEINASGTSR